MEPFKMEKNKEGFCECPQCGGKLTFIEYVPMTIIDGKINREDQDPHYECGCCNTVYRRIVSTDYYQTYERVVRKNNEPIQLQKDKDGILHCPRCQSPLVYFPSAPVRVLDGKLDMKDTEPRYECGCCNFVFRRLVHTDFFLCDDRKVSLSSDAVQLQKDANDKVLCPRCQEELRYVEYQPVQVIDGSVNLDRGEAHYACDHCHLTYRRIVHTDFYQVYDKNQN